MVAILAKVKSNEIQNLVKWNKTTFNIRESLGLIGLRTFKEIGEDDVYYVFHCGKQKNKWKVMLTILIHNRF